MSTAAPTKTDFQSENGSSTKNRENARHSNQYKQKKYIKPRTRTNENDVEDATAATTENILHKNKPFRKSSENVKKEFKHQQKENAYASHQYYTQLLSLKEVFSEWSDEELISVLVEFSGDLEVVVSRISEGFVKPFSQVKTNTSASILQSGVVHKGRKNQSDIPLNKEDRKSHKSNFKSFDHKKEHKKPQDKKITLTEKSEKSAENNEVEANAPVNEQKNSQKISWSSVARAAEKTETKKAIKEQKAESTEKVDQKQKDKITVGFKLEEEKGGNVIAKDSVAVQPEKKVAPRPAPVTLDAVESQMTAIKIEETSAVVVESKNEKKTFQNVSTSTAKDNSASILVNSPAQTSTTTTTSSGIMTSAPLFPSNNGLSDFGLMHGYANAYNDHRNNPYVFPQINNPNNSALKVNTTTHTSASPSSTGNVFGIGDSGAATSQHYSPYFYNPYYPYPAAGLMGPANHQFVSQLANNNMSYEQGNASVSIGNTSNTFGINAQPSQQSVNQKFHPNGSNSVPSSYSSRYQGFGFGNNYGYDENVSSSSVRSANDSVDNISFQQQYQQAIAAQMAMMNPYLFHANQNPYYAAANQPSFGNVSSPQALNAPSTSTSGTYRHVGIGEGNIQRQQSAYDSSQHARFFPPFNSAFVSSNNAPQSQYSSGSWRHANNSLNENNNNRNNN